MAKTTVEKELPKLRHSMNYFHITGDFEHNVLPSGTKPDLALSIPEIMLRYTQGRPVPQLKDHEYHMDMNIPDVRTLDLVERENLYKYVKDQVLALNESVKEKQSKRNKLLKEQETKLKSLIAFASEYEKEKITKAGDEA